MGWQLQEKHTTLQTRFFLKQLPSKRVKQVKRSIPWILTFEFFPPLRADCTEYVLWTTCSGVEGDLSEEWSEPFSTMFSPSWLCGVGERERLRRTGEQAGVLLFELLAVLKRKERKGDKKKKINLFILMVFILKNKGQSAS